MIDFPVEDPEYIESDIVELIAEDIEFIGIDSARVIRLSAVVPLRTSSIVKTRSLVST